MSVTRGTMCVSVAPMTQKSRPTQRVIIQKLCVRSSAALDACGRALGVVPSGSGGSPSGDWPRSSGEDTTKRATTGSTKSAVKAPKVRKPPRQPTASMSQAEIRGMATPEREIPMVATPRAMPRRRSNQFATSFAVARPPMEFRPKPTSVARIR